MDVLGYLRDLIILKGIESIPNEISYSIRLAAYQYISVNSDRDEEEFVESFGESAQVLPGLKKRYG